MKCKLREPVSGLAHAAGALLSVAALTVMVVMAVHYKTTWHVVSYSIFGTSLILLYTASSFYHLLPFGEHGVKIMQEVDHTMIYVLIAGTYTPFCLVTLRGPWGWSMFGIIWGLAVAGIVTKFAWKTAPRIFRVIFYLVMGWLAIILIFPLYKVAPEGTIQWLMTGGFFYSIGAIFYTTKWPNPIPKVFGFHEIWHLFVMGGSFSHFWAIYRFI